MAHTIDFIRNLFSSSDTSNVWTLYRMSRGRDSVSPAVLRKLASSAAK